MRRVKVKTVVQIVVEIWGSDDVDEEERPSRPPQGTVDPQDFTTKLPETTSHLRD